MNKRAKTYHELSSDTDNHAGYSGRRGLSIKGNHFVCHLGKGEALFKMSIFVDKPRKPDIAYGELLDDSSNSSDLRSFEG